MSIRFDGQVAIVTGAGNGLGRSHALELARRGAKVVVNDLGSAVDGNGASTAAASAVVEEIESFGGEALANGANVTDYAQVEAMVDAAMARWGRVDILINNAGILRDKSFSKVTLDEFKLIIDVHLMGSVNCCKAVWEIMKAQNYGRIVMTTSSSGLYGNFGQTNYGAGKMAVLGLMNTLVLEGEKFNIHTNALAPAAGTRMLEGLVASEVLELLTPSSVTAGAMVLCHSEAPNRTILCAGAGGYAASRIVESEGIYLPEEQQTPEQVAAHWAEITDPAEQQELFGGFKQTEKFISKAMAYLHSQSGVQE
ncbi:SDR family NAD(P)-dependent oxidoreductase [Gammaproteobacteria bacterium LSUCC0057]|uniref:SDR family NAD(P)-dependent oxidoreductase n=1 Tax=Gammaproteobacteria bacterium LSUCC0057 TaxID=2559237 RepID=A0A4Y8UHB2_9GAMM|nr:SDR family NAD(P)-dependent oxidoreductase [Gammaproteobacteria bacterium LSUCC0057]